MILRRFDKGFTLIEIVTVIVVLGILGAFTFTFIDNAIKTYMIADKQRNLYQEAAYIMERMTRELRDATSTDTTTPYTLQFTRQHTTQDTNTTIKFRRDAGTNTFYRDSGVISYVMGKNVTQFLITKSTPTLCGSYLTLSLTLSEGGQTFTLTSMVTPKNLGSGSYNDRCFNGDYEDVIQ